jgi:GT2 family glycosyltransferase/glycosyltransferase involved in cell wall biosynthesis
MSGRVSDKLEVRRESAPVVIFVQTGKSGPADDAWLEQVRAMGMPVFSHAAYAGCEKTVHALSQLGLLLDELANSTPACAIVTLSTDLALDSQQLKALCALTASDDSPVARSVLTNAVAAYNPFAGLSGDQVPQGQLTEVVELLGTGREHGHHVWPDHFLALSAKAVAALCDPEINRSNAYARLQDADGRLQVSDRVFVLAPSEKLFNSARLQAHESVRPPSWGTLSARLKQWLDAGCPPVALDLAKKKPVTLHVTHSWGGGVALWTNTFMATDQKSAHLQLRSEGPQSGQGAGQRLSLYAGDILDCALASWWLQPPIQSIQNNNDQYRQILEEICSRYGVGRIMVSSLVGHSLDVLRLTIPTVQVLHDHFPAWPFLSANPALYLDEDGSPDIAVALQDKGLGREFADRGAQSWHAIRDQYREAIQENNIKLAAPSRSVIQWQKTIDPGWKDVEIEHIPHGFPPMEEKQTVEPRPRRDGRLRLVILGRIQDGKGKKLLLDSLPRLQPYAQVYLVGAGKNGEAFFGLSGVNVIVEYQREELAGLLSEIGPDLAGLLSIVPETFSYTLSELHYLGVPAIATRVGSFPERIEHGKNGWLIDPSVNDLANMVEHLTEHRAELESVRKTLSEQDVIDSQDMVKAYRTLCKPGGAANAFHAAGSSLAEIQSSALAFQDGQSRDAREKAESEASSLQAEVRKRTNWALDSQRELKEEQVRRKRWVDQLEGKLALVVADLSESRVILDQKNLRLKQINLDLEQQQNLHEQILASSSWKITRPFRVLRRTGQNFVRSRAWNPLRWPLLFSGVIRNLSTVGLRGTLMRLQFGGYEEPPAPVPVAELESVGNPRPPSSVPRSEQPLISIVIPAYNNWVYTAACLRSINDARDAQRIEVILVDDESSDETEHNASKIQGLIYLRNEENSGFIESCNRGAGKAQGKFLVLLNNDTQVIDGWLDSLLDAFELHPDAGLVGSRLVYPDGSLQECGGLVFKDGSGWNYGKGDNPERPEYMHIRDADYCSGASIMIKTELFRKLGGFDERYKPAYYEDTDLAFAVRAAGKRVLVQPASTVIHHEGITSGTDTDSGTKRYQVVNQKTFSERWAKELTHFSERIDDPTNPAVIRAARDHRLRGRVLIVDATTPEPDQDSGSLRLTHVMRCFMKLGFGVTFFADNHGYAGKYTRQMQQWGVEVVYQPWIESNQAFFRQRGAEFDYIMVSRHYIASNYVSNVRRFCPQAKFIFDTVDLHYLREQRLAELEDNQALRQVASMTRRSELSVIEKSDAVLVVSETEVEILKEDAPEALVHVLSNIHDVPGCQQEFEEREDMFFVGGYQHPPNIDAAKWFVNKIWPLVHAELPDVKFHLIGSKAPDSVRELKGDGVIFHGFVEDLEHYLDHCRIAVAPLRYGAGVKGKVNMSMSHGQPVVATLVAVEGLHAEHGHDVLVGETEEEFAREVVRLYLDKELWNRISAAAIKNVESHFSVAAASANLESLLARLNNEDQD